MTFKELNLKDDILSAIEELGYEQPMPVQAQAIPFMLEKTGWQNYMGTYKYYYSGHCI